MHQAQIEKSTKTPWRITPENKTIIEAQHNYIVASLYDGTDTLTDESEANAALIVTAVNEHDLLNRVAECAKAMCVHFSGSTVEDLKNALVNLCEHRKSGGE